MNKQLLNKIYETIFNNEPSFLDSWRNVDSEIRKIVDEHAGILDKQEVGLLPELQQHLKL